MKLYGELADWWHVFSPPEGYEEEAAEYAAILENTCSPQRVLELGAGGGNVASFLKRRFPVDLVDLSPAMLRQAARLNPECRQFVGDMRTVRLAGTYDAVLVHDAVMYMRTGQDLRDVMETAFACLRPGGAALFVPDCTRETFFERTEPGGGDRDGRSVRYVEWTRDPNIEDTEYNVDFAILLRSQDGSVQCVEDHHVFGLFPREDWLQWLEDAGFSPELIEGPSEVFLGRRPF